jgi:hypothetical protein
MTRLELHAFLCGLLGMCGLWIGLLCGAILA